jgi:regulator of RNase E activity RraA
VVAFPREAAAALIERARAQLAKEEEGVRAIAEGRWDRSWIGPLEKKLGLA